MARKALKARVITALFYKNLDSELVTIQSGMSRGDR
jgi:hypothetical protein